MTYLIMKTYVGYTSISNVGRSVKWTFGQRVFGVGYFSDLLAWLFSQHVDIGKTLSYEDIWLIKRRSVIIPRTKVDWTKGLCRTNVELGIKIDVGS